MTPRATRRGGTERNRPDILRRGLRVVFCGINPASSAERAGHNFSSASNRFWQTLNLAGFTPRRLEPHEERLLLDYGCGITAVIGRATRRVAEVPAREFRAERQRFEAKMRRYAPECIAFLGKRGLASMIGVPDLAWGRQDYRIGSSLVWVLPNPSGLNRAFSLQGLVREYAELLKTLQG